MTYEHEQQNIYLIIFFLEEKKSKCVNKFITARKLFYFKKLHNCNIVTFNFLNVKEISLFIFSRKKVVERKRKIHLFIRMHL